MARGGTDPLDLPDPDPNADPGWSPYPPGVGPPSDAPVIDLAHIPNADKLWAHIISGAGYNPQTIAAQTYDPTLVTAPDETLYSLGPSQFENIHVDPSTRLAQLEALTGMQRALSMGGFDDTERARLEAVLLAQRQAQTAGAQGALQEASRRGLDSSATSLAASLFASQQQAQAESQQAMQVGLQAEQRRQQLRESIGGLAGNIRSQDYGQAADKARAIDAINEFNVNNKQQYARDVANRELQARTFNAGATNEAARFNAGQRQSAAQFNADAANTEARFAADTAFQAQKHNAEQLFEAEKYNSSMAWQTNRENSNIDAINARSAQDDYWKRRDDTYRWYDEANRYPRMFGDKPAAKPQQPQQPPSSPGTGGGDGAHEPNWPQPQYPFIDPSNTGGG